MIRSLSGSKGRARAILLLIVAVLAVFLVRLPFGAYTTVHGPVTALRAVRYSQLVQSLLLLATLVMLWAYQGYRLSQQLAYTSHAVDEPQTLPPAKNLAVLRC